MFTRTELAQLERSYRSGKALSIYLDGSSHDPAQRSAWRRDLGAALAVLRETLRDTAPAEREAFDLCVERMTDSLGEYRGALRARGWVGFFPEQGVAHTEALPVSMTPVVAWGEGIRVAPYVRALKQHEPAVVAVVDAGMARVYHHAFGVLEEVETLRAHAHLHGVAHPGYPPRQGVHTGTAGAEASARELRAATADMLRELADRLVTLAGARGWILVGGIPEVATDVMSLLPIAVEHRVHRLAGLDVGATHDQIGAAAERGATEARRARDLAIVTDLLDRDAAGGHGIAGFVPTLEALHEHAVECLCFTGSFLRAHPMGAELLVRTAFEQNVEPEYVSGAAAERLDEVASGVGACLRFVPLRVQPPLVPAGPYRRPDLGGERRPPVRPSPPSPPPGARA